MASPTQWTWVWASSWSWWWTGRPGVLQSMGLGRVGRDWVTELTVQYMTLKTTVKTSSFFLCDYKLIWKTSSFWCFFMAINWRKSNIFPLRTNVRDFPDGCRGCKFRPRLGTKIPHAEEQRSSLAQLESLCTTDRECMHCNKITPCNLVKFLLLSLTKTWCTQINILKKKTQRISVGNCYLVLLNWSINRIEFADFDGRIWYFWHKGEASLNLLIQVFPTSIKVVNTYNPKKSRHYKWLVVISLVVI